MCWRWPCSPFACGSRLSTAVCAAWPTAWKPSVARWPNCRWSSGAAPTRPAATGTGGGRQRPLPPRRPSLLPRPLLLVRPCPHVVRELRCRWGHRAARPCPRGGPCRLPRAPLRARCPEDVGRAPPRLAAGGRPAAFRCRRSRRWTPGCRAHRRCSSPSWCPIASCRARLAARRSAPLPLARPPSWRLARLAEPRRPLRPSALSARRRPAPPLLRAPPQPPALLRAFPPRPRASPRCSPLTARLPAPAPATRARGLSATRVGGVPLRNVPSSLKRPAPRMLSARAFLRYG